MEELRPTLWIPVEHMDLLKEDLTQIEAWLRFELEHRLDATGKAKPWLRLYDSLKQYLPFVKGDWAKMLEAQIVRQDGELVIRVKTEGLASHKITVGIF